jgi:nuclear pore complex protein Nup210
MKMLLFFADIRILKFSESSYIAQPYIKILEDQGRRGDRILMRGLHTGAAVITVKPSDPVYKVHLVIVE